MAGMARRDGPDEGGRDALRGAAVTSAWTLGSRLLGYLRDALMAAAFGVTPVFGALALAWVVPNLFRRLFGEGAVGAAVQPALARAESEGGPAAAHALFARFHGFLLIVLFALVAVGELLLGAWREVLGGDAAHVETRRTLLYSMVLLPYVVPICLTALLAAPQNLRGGFWRPALGPVLLNLCWIAALLWPLPPGAGDETLAFRIMAAILVGGVLQWAVQLPGVRGSGWPLRPVFGAPDPRLRAALATFLPALLGLAAAQLAAVVDQVMVRWLVDPSANAYTYLANRLLHLPLALIGVAAVTGAMPWLARLAAAGDRAGLARAVRRNAEPLLLLTVAAAAGLWAVADPAVRVLFERRRFTPDDTAVLVGTLRAYLFGLPAAALAGLLVRAHQASGHYATPARIAGAMLPLDVVANLLLIPWLGVAGAGWATSLVLTVQCLWLLRRLRTEDLLPEPVLRVRDLPTLLLPGFLAGGAAALALHLLGDAAPTLGLVVAIPVGLLAFAGAAWRLRGEDWSSLLAALRRRG